MTLKSRTFVAFSAAATLLLGLPFASPEVRAEQNTAYKGDVTIGRDLARANCSRCHQVELDGASPVDKAIPFWMMSGRRDVNTIAKMLIEKASPKHSIMPTFTMSDRQAYDIAAWVAWVQPIAHGHRLVENSCSRCHAIGKTGESPHPEAVRFRDISKFYEVEMLEEAFAEGIAVGHPDMPVFQMTPLQIDDVIQYLNTIQEKE